VFQAALVPTANRYVQIVRWNLSFTPTGTLDASDPPITVRVVRAYSNGGIAGTVRRMDDSIADSLPTFYALGPSTWSTKWDTLQTYYVHPLLQPTIEVTLAARAPLIVHCADGNAKGVGWEVAVPASYSSDLKMGGSWQGVVN
jgi:hypothetical protein